jgi:hypothetical protein
VTRISRGHRYAEGTSRLLSRIGLQTRVFPRCVSPPPIVFAEHVAAQGHWGATLREYMRDYVHWATFGALCEFLPLSENRETVAVDNRFVTLPADASVVGAPNRASIT